MLPVVTEAPPRLERRPMSVVIALVALWFLGMETAGEGLATVELVRDPLWNGLVPFGEAGLDAVRMRAYMQATREHGELLLPVGVGQLMLGCLLVFVSVRALLSGRGTASFMFQVLTANVVLACVGYALRQPVRGAMIEAIVTSGVLEPAPGQGGDAFDGLMRTNWWWYFRLALGMQLFTFLVSAWVLGRRSARALLFAPVNARAED